MDVFDGQNYYSQMFNFEETPPLNSNFEFMGVGDKNFVMNSGSYFIFMVGLVLGEYISYLINMTAVRFSQYKIARTIGQYSYNKSYKNSVWDGMLKMFLECYFDLALCAVLGMHAFIETKHEAAPDRAILRFFNGRDNVLNSLITIVYSLMIIVFPFVGFFAIRKHYDILKVKKIDKMYGVFYSDHKINTK